MKFLYITSILKPDGYIDYKGLDISKFIPGSQFYDYAATKCVVATTEDYQGEHPDIAELTEAEYKAKVEELKATYPEPEPQPDPAAMQAQLDALTIAMAAMLGGEA